MIEINCDIFALMCLVISGLKIEWVTFFVCFLIQTLIALFFWAELWSIILFSNQSFSWLVFYFDFFLKYVFNMHLLLFNVSLFSWGVVFFMIVEWHILCSMGYHSTHMIPAIILRMLILLYMYKVLYSINVYFFCI